MCCLEACSLVLHVAQCQQASVDWKYQNTPKQSFKALKIHYLLCGVPVTAAPRVPKAGESSRSSLLLQCNASCSTTLLYALPQEEQKPTDSHYKYLNASLLLGN